MSVEQPTRPTIHELIGAVREHPDFVAGAVWTRLDFEDREWDDFNTNRFEDAVVEAGNVLIDSELGWSE